MSRLPMLALSAALAAAACTGDGLGGRSAGTAAPSGTSHDDPQGVELNYFKRAHEGTIPLLTGGGETAQVREVVIRTGRGTLAVSASDGVATIDQNRLRLSGAPVVGGLFQHRYSLDDIQERDRVGTAYLGEGRLFVDLDRTDRYQPVTRVVVLNQHNAYDLQAPPRSSRDLSLPTGTPAGGAYLKDGETLIVVIEPTILRSNIFKNLL